MQTKKTLLLLAGLLLSSYSLIPVHASTWVHVTTFIGASSMNTDYFTINHTEWRLNWSYTPIAGEEQYANFYVDAYEKTGSGWPIHVSEMGNTTTSGMSYAHNANGTYYLTLGASSLTGYTIIIEEDVDSLIAEYPTLIVVIAAAATLVLAIEKRRNPKGASSLFPL